MEGCSHHCIRMFMRYVDQMTRHGDDVAARVAAMTEEEREARMYEIADSDDRSDAMMREFCKLFLWPGADLMPEEQVAASGIDWRAVADLEQEAAQRGSLTEISEMLDMKGYQRID